MPYRMTNKYFYAEAITEPENVIRHLAKQEPGFPRLFGPFRIVR